jgi:peptidyl-prolyl cis-trans isomerase B (cyclophilin B)
MRSLALALALALALVLAGCGSDDDDGPTATGNGDTSGECESVEAPEPRGPETREAPTEPLADGTYALVVATNCGSFTMTLDLTSAPNTTASLVALAQDGFYDDTTFHRVVPNFVIQGGDPTGAGAGGPGYQTVDEPAADARYVKGVVAMAKSPVDPRGAAGSQFFVVTGEEIALPPDYAIVGEVTEGMETVDRIAALGVANGPPSQPVVIETITVEES